MPGRSCNKIKINIEIIVVGMGCNMNSIGRRRILQYSFFCNNNEKDIMKRKFQIRPADTPGKPHSSLKCVPTYGERRPSCYSCE